MAEAKDAALNDRCCATRRGEFAFNADLGYYPKHLVKKLAKMALGCLKMNRNTNEYLPALLNMVTGVGVLLISFSVELRFPMPKEIAKPLGLFIVVAGMSLVVWAAIHIRGAFLGEVEPRLDVLVQDGPYRFIRHPVYLGMTIAFVGAAITLRSWPGLIGVFLLFLPSEVYRARLEEKALFRKFGSEWENYVAQTGFIFPFIGKE